MKRLGIVFACIVLGLSAAPVVFGAGGDGDDGGGGCQGAECHCGGDGPGESDWDRYGFALPNDPNLGDLYNLEQENPYEKNLVGFAAKGNIVVGDYLSEDFQDDTTPNLEPPFTRAYRVDPTDAGGDLGYDNADPVDCGGFSPCFSGNYNEHDGGFKLDPFQQPDPAAPRKFYESTLSDEDFAALIDPTDRLYDSDAIAVLDGVYYTNHAFAARVQARRLYIQGSLVARDDAIRFGAILKIAHDLRLLDQEAGAEGSIILPLQIGQPTLFSYEECPPDGCP